MGNLDALIATLSPAGVDPSSFGMLRMCGSTSAIASITAFVPSTLGPTARMISYSPS
jgi:hypothetical protein